MATIRIAPATFDPTTHIATALAMPTEVDEGEYILNLTRSGSRVIRCVSVDLAPYHHIIDIDVCVRPGTYETAYVLVAR
jgi:hypothetical protein